MNNEFFKTNFKYNEAGELVLEGNYDMVGEMVSEIIAQKETLWKRFCQDVCEKMVAYYYEDSIDLLHFHKVFNEKFNEVTEHWKGEK